MELSIYLAEGIGLYLLIVGLALLVRREKMISIVREIIAHPALLFITGILALVFGDVLLLVHNVWLTNWRIVITLIGWIALIKGIIRILLPELAVKAMRSFISYDVFYYLMTLIIFVLGFYLICAAFLIG